MQRVSLTCGAAAVCSAFALGQLGAGRTAGDTAEEDAARPITFRLTEVRAAEAQTGAPSAPAVLRSLAAREAGTEELVTLRLTTVVGERVRAQFGESVPVASSVSRQDRGAEQLSYTYRDVGAIVSLVATAQESGVLLHIEYESSRLDESEEVMRTVEQTSIETTLRLEPGIPTLVGGSSASGTMLIVSFDG